MRIVSHDPATVFRGAPAIIVGNHDARLLRELVVRHVGSADHAAAEHLDAELRRAIVVPQAEVPPEVVAMGSRVAFEDVRTTQCAEVELAYPEEADPARGRLSVLSPVGLALLGATAWETVEVETPHGELEELRVVSVAPGTRAS